MMITAGGAYTMTWFATIAWENHVLPTLNSTNTDVLRFISIDGGVNWFGMKVAGDCAPV